MSFAQFTDLLEEPTEEMLWMLLGRRAAGVLRRDHKDSAVVIPIFSGQRVSFILVRVKNKFETTSILDGEDCEFEDENSMSADVLQVNIYLRTASTSGCTCIALPRRVSRNCM